MFPWIHLLQLALAVLVYGMTFAENKAKYTFMVDNRSRHAWSVLPALLTLIPVVGIVIAGLVYVLSDFARHGVRFK